MFKNILEKFKENSKNDKLSSLHQINSEFILIAKHLTKEYRLSKEIVAVLDDISMQFKPGKIYGLIGSSGSGKTTLLHILSLLSSPTSGSIIFNGWECDSLSDKDLSQIRNKYFGFVYQFHCLLSDFTIIENILMPSNIDHDIDKKLKNRANELMKMFGISNIANHSPSEISGGQRQRAAICRAMINSPKIIFADEPTGNLDHNNANHVYDILKAYVRKHKATIIMATHTDFIIDQLDEIIDLHKWNM